MLQPDQGCIKPNVDVQKAAELIKKLYGLEPEGGAAGIKEFVSYDDKNFFFRPDKRYLILPIYINLQKLFYSLVNLIQSSYLFLYRFKSDNNRDIFYEDGYILKIANILEDSEALKAQNELMLHLHEKKSIQVCQVKFVNENLLCKINTYKLFGYIDLRLFVSNIDRVYQGQLKIYQESIWHLNHKRKTKMTIQNKKMEIRKRN